MYCAMRAIWWLTSLSTQNHAKGHDRKNSALNKFVKRIKEHYNANKGFKMPFIREILTSGCPPGLKIVADPTANFLGPCMWWAAYRTSAIRQLLRDATHAPSSADFLSPRTPVERALVYPAVGAVMGSWAGAIPIGLDWERPWQVRASRRALPLRSSSHRHGHSRPHLARSADISLVLSWLWLLVGLWS